MKTAKFLVLLLALFIFCFCWGAFVIAADTSNPTPLICGMDATIRGTDFLNIRDSAGETNIIGEIVEGEHFTVLDQSGEWFEIQFGQIHGYVHWKYIQFTEMEPNELVLGNSIIQYKSSSNRDTNMFIACETINGIVLQPGEEFVWSEVIGQTTKEKGYLSAPVLVNRQSVLGLGGGVCQVSTTIYNALFDTQITPTVVYAHSVQSAYAEKNATVSHGSKDFVFSNSYDFPVLIEAQSYKGVVIITLRVAKE